MTQGAHNKQTLKLSRMVIVSCLTQLFGVGGHYYGDNPAVVRIKVSAAHTLGETAHSHVCQPR
jgi:hypothetical protein